MSVLEKLRSVSGLIGSESSGQTPPSGLLALYSDGRGFSAFSNSLLVPPLSVAVAMHAQGVVSWLVGAGEFCFAFDLFGAPFVLGVDGSVVRVDPETGERHAHSPTLEDWATIVVKKPNYELGQSLALEWVSAHGRFGVYDRLLPVKPFVIGGEYRLDNLRRCELERALNLYRRLSNQLAGLSDGQQVELSGWAP